MASVKLQPSEPFNFQTPDRWLHWHRHFEQFRIVSGLSTESEVHQLSTLLYCLGNESEDILTLTNVIREEKKKLFKVRHNVIFKRVRFNQRNQNEGESYE